MADTNWEFHNWKLEMLFREAFYVNDFRKLILRAYRFAFEKFLGIIESTSPETNFLVVQIYLRNMKLISHKTIYWFSPYEKLTWNKTIH